ncbi:hypothetical protein [Kitasatospora sp. NPDC093806]|uniref:hypothetical protein n=1 Tax=Kitasatospora sp. NPDC093806 TaxID=3155075 RepID=UPI00343BB038
MAITAPHRTGPTTASGSARRVALGSARRVGYAAALLPASLVTIGAVATGRADRARRWWAAAAGQDPRAAAHQPGPARLLAHALLCVPLGLLALIPIAMEALFVLRGVLYPLVQPGPYTDAWGGPTMGGAWLAHFGVGLPTALAGLGALWLLHRLHARLAGGLWGHRVGLAPVLTTVALLAGGTLLVNAWLHQL